MTQMAQGVQRLEEYTVVDTDVHLRIPREKIVPYVEEPYDKQVDRGNLPSDSWDRYKSGRIEKLYVDSAADLDRELCSKFNIDYPIVNAAAPWLTKIPQPGYASAIMRAYNDYLVDNVLDQNDDYFGLAQITLQDPHAAVEEIERLGDEPQIVGLYLVPMGHPVPIGDPMYNDIYQVAEDHDLTIAFHPQGTATAVDFPKQYHGFNEYISVHTLGFVWGQMQTIVSLIEQAIPVKFPDLNFIFLEGDMSWVPGLMFRLNKEYASRRDEIPLLEKLPEEYIKEWYFASQPLGEPVNQTDMFHIFAAIDAPKTVTFSSDFPHWDFDSSSEMFGYLDAHFDEEERRQILSGNAIKAFNLSL